MSARDVYPKYSLPTGGWTTDPERAARLRRKYVTRRADRNCAYVRTELASRYPGLAAALEHAVRVS